VIFGEHLTLSGALRMALAYTENQGELDVIARYKGWQYFVSLTFAGAEPTITCSRKLVFAHLYRASRLLRVPFGRLVWCLRIERGERLGRLHYHALIGGSVIKPTIGLCFTLNALWDALPRCGFARHRLYDGKQNGVAYVTTCLAIPGSTGADFYESQKFGSRGSDVMLAGALLRVVGGKSTKRARCVRNGDNGNKNSPDVNPHIGSSPENGVERWTDGAV